jgi:hypothetical protein
MIIHNHDATTTLHAIRPLLNSAYQSGCHHSLLIQLQVNSLR